MKREHKMAWYLGKLVRLTKPVEMISGGEYAPGRVFRVFSHGRRRLSLCPPDARACPWLRVVIYQVDLSSVEIVGEDETSFCRVCGCCDAQGCDPDDDGRSCWWANAEHTLCSRCAAKGVKI